MTLPKDCLCKLVSVARGVTGEREEPGGPIGKYWFRTRPVPDWKIGSSSDRRPLIANRIRTMTGSRGEVGGRGPWESVPWGDRNQNVMVCFHCSDYRGPQVDLKLTGGCARAVILEKRVSELADSTLSSCGCFFGQSFQIFRCQDCLNFKVNPLF